MRLGHLEKRELDGQDVTKAVSLASSCAALIPTAVVQDSMHNVLVEGSMKELGSITMGCRSTWLDLEVGMGMHMAAILVKVRQVGASDTHLYMTQRDAGRSDHTGIYVGGFREFWLTLASSKDSSHKRHVCKPFSVSSRSCNASALEQSR